MKGFCLGASIFWSLVMLVDIALAHPFKSCAHSLAMAALYFLLYQQLREVEQLRKALKKSAELLQQQNILLIKARNDFNGTQRTWMAVAGLVILIGLYFFL